MADKITQVIKQKKYLLERRRNLLKEIKIVQDDLQKLDQEMFKLCKHAWVRQPRQMYDPVVYQCEKCFLYR